jgi:hypothetical protein
MLVNEDSGTEKLQLIADSESPGSRQQIAIDLQCSSTADGLDEWFTVQIINDSDWRIAGPGQTDLTIDASTKF